MIIGFAMALPALLMSMIPDIVNKGIDIFDRKFQTDAEREQAKAEFKKETEQRLQSAWEEEQRQLTERHKNDMASDSWLSKNIRPITLIYLMALFTLAFFRDVDNTTLSLLKELMMTVFIFYFGARGLEKITSYVRNK